MLNGCKRESKPRASDFATAKLDNTLITLSQFGKHWHNSAQSGCGI